MLQAHHFPLTRSLHHSSISTLSSSSLSSPYRPPTLHSVRTNLRTRPQPWLAQLPEPTTTTTTTPQDGPVELPPSSTAIFATTDNPSPLQVATSVLLTGAISVFLFRSLRRRAKRAKELKFRSTGAKRTLKDEALDSLKAMTPAPVDAGSPPSPIQALLGGLTAGVIAIFLYKFATTIEASLNRQTISDNFSVRQITITIRTIINGVCYLATFVFGINAVGLILYSGQLAINSFMEGSTSKPTSEKGDDPLSMSSPSTKIPEDGQESNDSNGNQYSDDTQ
ncbi:hypothetical protein HHK36_023594 [Tetracentron sinense]|uniref:Transmembrane protein n=1 Tax=Tetracentron sinense TaxID=13715 RepID=A0A835D820_TETSI|nr:hypothetical protein HHK36_023594 [Tetracentron sinense]